MTPKPSCPSTADSQRSVWQQELNLTPAQRLAMRDFLEWNARKENRFYRYDYYRRQLRHQGPGRHGPGAWRRPP